MLDTKQCLELVQWATSKLEHLSVRELKERYIEFQEKTEQYCKTDEGYMDNGHLIAVELFRCLINIVIAEKERQSQAPGKQRGIA